ncbi:hypothetical protein [Bradyrhizobium japonicum]|uniref:hypothetical protein n=1 Tax=Bradyrhizobium japonicum TaxID=375 RepID=UPI00045694B7|nr:hypothetical protein [Bradyrhizobium japonicum]AHY52594.1 hypothetical protein BJS_05842 [Bradyrhizobium japonicum SEMIA 5079]MCD9112981.1 hypothetical protein [Bradyrhizobium japonicum]MCD9260474.1 hypothetical protein [Bradyrhizobium japonicum SEMIA 5079]MCD9824899.1 hypothetical protein [Bradyrhizobium japonicum]MCD9897802.1 hypothetical protein [Bradyrhizobium japonicum]
MTKGKLSWRDALPIHPAAELLPLMSEQELRELGDDIQKNGLYEGVAVFEGQLLDGRNRLDAMEIAGATLVTGSGKPDWENIRHRNVAGRDPVSFVMSKNVHRRHLSTEQKQELIAKLLILAPDKSNRQIAATVKVSHMTVGSVRAELQSTGQISQLTKTIGRDGRLRKQPTMNRRVRSKSELQNRDQGRAASEINSKFDNLVKAWQSASPSDKARFLNFIGVAHREGEEAEQRNDAA